MSATSAAQLIVSPLYARLLAKFPQSLTFCFAYGSGVKKQLPTKRNENGAGTGSNMIDLIYCVDNAHRWHESNLRSNADHYSAWRYLGAGAITRLQENYGARVYYNTLVPIDGTLIKYGVVTTRDLVTDLLEWSHLYLAGRLHKPVHIVRSPGDSELQAALQINLQSAVHATLLLLPDAFTEYEFYHAISSLSYQGDFRMVFGENKQKVRNIVQPQLVGFRNLYRPILRTLNDYADFPMLNDDSPDLDVKCRQDTSALAKLHHLNQLPRWPLQAMTRLWNRGSYKQDTEDVLRAIAYDPDCAAIVAQCIANIVLASSIKQSLKGLLTAGLTKSVKYSSKKIVKMFAS